MITSITLDQLSCSTETEGGGSHPYLWAVLLQVDDKTIASGALVARIGFAPSPIGAQIIIAEGMRAGATAQVPAPQQRMAAQFDPGQERRDLILITVLWDQHDLPFDAVLAGYDAFLGTSRDAVAANLAALGSSSPEIQQAATDAVKATVNQQVNDAIDGKLSLVFKLEIKAHLKTPDKVIDSAFAHFAVAEADSTSMLSLPFGAGSGHDYRIDGTFTVIADPCESELIRIRAAQEAIANTEGALKKLIGHEGPSTEKQIELLEEELSTQKNLLAVAEADLSQCRARTSATPGS
jgi:hypothetical protein